MRIAIEYAAAKEICADASMESRYRRDGGNSNDSQKIDHSDDLRLEIHRRILRKESRLVIKKKRKKGKKGKIRENKCRENKIRENKIRGIIRIMVETTCFHAVKKELKKNKKDKKLPKEGLKRAEKRLKRSLEIQS